MFLSGTLSAGCEEARLVLRVRGGVAGTQGVTLGIPRAPAVKLPEAPSGMNRCAAPAKAVSS